VKKRIVYWGGCWTNNIGNAFIDYGAIYTIKKACPDADIHLTSEFSRWLYLANRQDLNKDINITGLITMDYLVFSGSALTSEATETLGPTLAKLSKRGVKIILNGCGGSEYEKSEIEDFKKLLERIKVYGFISRDRFAYQSYKDCCSNSFDGIDCAFFLPEAFHPAPLSFEEFVVFNFDYIKEPDIPVNNKRIIRSHHDSYRYFPDSIRANSTFLGFDRKIPFMHISSPWSGGINFKHSDVLISDLPDDYLNLYANASAVYSDRVHTCVATLAFGNLARLYTDTRRATLFERVGITGIKDKLEKLDLETLKTDKDSQISFLKRLLGT